MKSLLLLVTLLFAGSVHAFPRWANDTNVRVYLLNLTPKERERVRLAIDSWDGLLPPGISFTIVGETNSTQTCVGCLTIVRQPTPKDEWGQCEASYHENIINFAIIRVDLRAGSGNSFQRVLAHEIGHSLGLDHRDGKSIMSAKPHGKPSQQDAAFLRAMYVAPAIARPTLKPALPSIDAGYIAKQEAQMITALQRYSFRREVLIQTLDDLGNVTGEYHRISRMVLGDDGERIEKVILKQSTLKNLRITKQDEADFNGAQMGIVNFSLHRFSQSPAGIVVEPVAFSERVFKGEIQVDKQGRIVRLEGTTLPEKKERFPRFISTRKEVGDYLFPSETFSEGVLRFPDHDVRVRWRVVFTDYKLFGSRVSIVEAQ